MKGKYLVLGLQLLLVLFGCPMMPQTGTHPAAPEGNAEHGTIVLYVPALSAYLAKALGVSPSVAASPGKAALIVNQVDLELWLGEELIETLTVNPNTGPNMGSPISWDVPAAAGYTISAKIYNTSVDAASPILSGVSEPFNVIAGGITNVMIRPVPIAPITMPSGQAVETTLESCFDTGTTQTVIVDYGEDGLPGGGDDITMETPVYGWREERWFSIDTSLYSAIRVNADVDASSGVYMMFADETGTARGHALSGALGNMGPAYWTYGGVATLGALTYGSDQCYLGLITVSSTVGSSVDSTVSVSFSPLTDDSFEENDTINDAKDLPITAPINGIDLDTADRHTWPGIGGDWYKITQTEENDPNVTIVLEFDMDVADLSLELVSWDGTTGSTVAESNTSTLSGPANPAAKEQERIVHVLDPGDYYLWVYGADYLWASGVNYRLWWVAGEGQTIIRIE